eukprot:363664-Chlamydomonas_euryale.AAC.28
MTTGFSNSAGWNGSRCWWTCFRAHQLLCRPGFCRPVMRAPAAVAQGTPWSLKCNTPAATPKALGPRMRRPGGLRCASLNAHAATAFAIGARASCRAPH